MWFTGPTEWPGRAVWAADSAGDSCVRLLVRHGMVCPSISREIRRLFPLFPRRRAQCWVAGIAGECWAWVGHAQVSSGLGMALEEGKRGQHNQHQRRLILIFNFDNCR